MWPHFLTEASWSSKCTPAAPASIIAASARRRSARRRSRLRHPRRWGRELQSPAAAFPPWPPSIWIWSARARALLMRRTTVGNGGDGVQRLVGIHLQRVVRVRRDLPAGKVDRRHAGLDLLHRLVAGEGAERIDEGALVQHAPQLLGAAPRERVLDLQAAAQLHYVFRARSRAAHPSSAGSLPSPAAALPSVSDARPRFPPGWSNSWTQCARREWRAATCRSGYAAGHKNKDLHGLSPPPLHNAVDDFRRMLLCGIRSAPACGGAGCSSGCPSRGTA